jgi:hypothetical protein
MSEIARHQLLITLVHGTWPRGFFRTFFPRIVRFKQRVRELTRRQRRDPPPFWFEECSPFLARLSSELGDISYKIKPLLWSGENSIYERDKTAQVLAEHLSAEHAEHPQATQLVIAHSHGGNIALRALHHLHQRDASRSCGAESANPLVVTLATPFVEVQPADFGDRPTLVRLGVLLAIALPLLIWAPGWLWPLGKKILPSDVLLIFVGTLITLAVLLLLYRFIGRNWLSPESQRARQNRVEALRDATRLGEIVSAQAQRLLIIRAIDDEASLALALGTISNYVITRAIMYVLWIALVPLPVTLILLIFRHQWYSLDDVTVASCAFILILLGPLLVARTAHGHELASSPMECQISTHSTPDAIGLSRIVTLVRRTFVKSLRHGIYDHEDCAKAISDWVRSQLCAPRVR